jgi:hypothetical protein
MMRKISEQLCELGLIEKSEHEKFSKGGSETDPLPSHFLKKISEFCPHDVGHYLG